VLGSLDDLVLDASVMLKWLLVDPEAEPDSERATALVQSVAAGATEMLQTFHWLAEVAAALARLMNIQSENGASHGESNLYRTFDVLAEQ
jgi:predicted nucleic acid-binding protein